MGLFEAAAFAFERSKKGCHFFLPCSLVVHFKPIMVVVYIYIYMQWRVHLEILFKIKTLEFSRFVEWCI